MSNNSSVSESVNFSEIQPKELEYIRQLRKENAKPTNTDNNKSSEIPATLPEKSEANSTDQIKSDLVGLAISGGGIRSATFALGVLEALKAKHVLKKIDYLSTVSGGGYIGSWLSANCKRNKGWLDDANWDDSIAHLRRYSNYLSPNFSLLSADTWSMGVIWLRNTLLIQVMLILAIACLLLLPRVLMPAINFGSGTFLIVAATLIFAYLIAWMGGNLSQIKYEEEKSERKGESYAPAKWITQRFWRKSSQLSVQVHILIWMAVSLGFAALLWELSHPNCGFVYSLISISSNPASLGMFLLLPYLGMTALSVCSSRNRLSSLAIAILPTLAMFLLFGFILYWIGDWKSPEYAIKDCPTLDNSGVIQDKGGDVLGKGGNILAFAWAPPMVLASFSLAINLLIGIQGSDSYDYVREWWGRFGAWLAIYGAVWMLVVVLAFYGPLGIERLYYEGSWKSLGSGWLLTTLSGILAGRSASTSSGEGENLTAKAKELLSKATPFIFIVGLLALVALCLHLLIANLDDTFYAQRDSLLGAERPAKLLNLDLESQSDIQINVSAEQATNKAEETPSSYPTHWKLLATAEENYPMLLGIFLVCAVLVYLFNRRLDINEFSLNAFYRNRLARCYLGASRTAANSSRTPHQFTGFDHGDDIRLHELYEDKQAMGPFHIINCALNLGGSSDLALNSRHSANFTLTPLYCGCSYVPLKQSGEPESIVAHIPKELGYVPTQQYGGSLHQPTLGQAISVSGAAASPNMGYHTLAPVAFLMTLFNARLGWWFPSPFKDKWNTPSPTHSLLFLLQELFGTANEKDDFLAISDGGHFENLAAYELIRRRCRVVIILDGECDPKLQFEGLANLIRLAAVDLDADVDIDVSSIRRLNDSAWSHNRCAIGKINYDPKSTRFPNPPTGACWLIYIKASMNGQEKTAIMQYKDTHPDFPHETTADQFYAEDQFESYRNLGKDIGSNLLNKWDDNKCKAWSVAEIAAELDTILSPELPIGNQFTRHADKLM